MLPEALFSQSDFPKTHKWIERFETAVQNASSVGCTTIDGKTAAEQILAGGFAEDEGDVLSDEPLQIKKGERVEVYPTDSGFNNKDQGTLLSLSEREIVIALDNGLHLHTPRAGFRVSRTAYKI